MFIAIFIAVRGECESPLVPTLRPPTIEFQNLDLHSCLAFVSL